MTEAAIIVFGPGGIDVARRAQAAIAGSEIHGFARRVLDANVTFDNLASIYAACLGPEHQSSVYALPESWSSFWPRSSPTRLRNRRDRSSETDLPSCRCWAIVRC